MFTFTSSIWNALNHVIILICNPYYRASLSCVPCTASYFQPCWIYDSPWSENSQPNLRASSKAVPSRAVWCISFLGIQPTFTHVPPRPRKRHLIISYYKSFLIKPSCFWFWFSYPRLCPSVWEQHNPEPWPSSPRQLLPVWAGRGGVKIWFMCKTHRTVVFGRVVLSL